MTIVEARRYFDRTGSLFNAREMILDCGIGAARASVQSKAERICVEAAAEMMGNDEDEIVYTSRAITSLPHKTGAQMRIWEQDAGDGVYRWLSGECDDSPVGVPYGAKSRMILIYLLNRAFALGAAKAGGVSLYKWNALMGNRSVGGMTYKIILEHSRRLSSCHLVVRRSETERAFMEPVKPMEDALTEGETAPYARDDTGFPLELEIDSQLLDELKDCIVPVRKSALRLISNNSAAIDLYIRLSDGLPGFDRPRKATWLEIKRRFGAGYKNIRQMKPAFLDTLNLVRAVYPEARVELASDGIVLYPGPGPTEQLFVA